MILYYADVTSWILFGLPWQADMTSSAIFSWQLKYHPINLYFLQLESHFLLFWSLILIGYDTDLFKNRKQRQMLKI